MPMKIRSRGFTLIEVLIALLILAIGLLGMASLLMTSLSSSHSAYQRSQASMLAYDMVERLRLNRTVATSSNSYAFSGASAVPSDPGCKSNGCNAGQIANQDLREWQENFQDVNGVGLDGDAYRPALAGATGFLAREGSRYLITISWDEDGSTACPRPAANALPRCSFELRVDL